MIHTCNDAFPAQAMILILAVAFALLVVFAICKASKPGHLHLMPPSHPTRFFFEATAEDKYVQETMADVLGVTTPVVDAAKGAEPMELMCSADECVDIVQKTQNPLGGSAAADQLPGGETKREVFTVVI